MRDRSDGPEGTTSDECWLGDGVTATFNGYDITLSTPRDGAEHWIALEPEAIRSLVRFARRIDAKYDAKHFAVDGV
jgi:hypothetical protein